MKELLLKEIKLCLAPINFVYLSFAAMMIIPNYPRYVPFFFFCVSILHLFTNALLNKDIQFSMILPITKREIVKARCLLVGAYELVGTILSIPFSILFTKVIQFENQSGIEGNVAFYGLVLILLSIFNGIFFVSYYKKAEKPGPSFLKASVGFWIFYIIFEAIILSKNIIPIPYIKILDQTDGHSLLLQLPILIAGILIYFIAWILTFHRASKIFEKVDL
ncbi:MAG: ABC-2 transporter permease [Treponema sp.]|nr:ABC-2 transporter permease [Treponema sp.]